MLITHCVTDSVLAVAGRVPTRRCLFTRSSSYESNTLADHEGGVKPDAELTDQFGKSLIRHALLKFFAQLTRSGFSNGSDVGDHFFAAHADTVVVDRERAPLRISFESDCQLFR